MLTAQLDPMHILNVAKVTRSSAIADGPCDALSLDILLTTARLYENITFEKVQVKVNKTYHSYNICYISRYGS